MTHNPDTREHSGGTVELSNAGKVLFPADGITKGDLFEYYEVIATQMLPWLRDRPVTMVRYPDGIGAHAILQKNAPEYFPAWVRRARVPKQGGHVDHVVCDKPATLAYLANQACIEVHAFLSRLASLDDPDQLIFDLDPADGMPFSLVRDAALQVRELVEYSLGLTCFVKTTGGDGLHVHVPISPSQDFDQVRGFARQVAETLVRRSPEKLTLQQRKQDRDRRIYLDVMRNGYAQTAVAPYSVRARAGAPVATPLSWDEVGDAKLRPGLFTIATVPDRVSRVANPWAGMPRRRPTLTRGEQRLSRLTGAKGQ
jgi:bifunctional non-homologous end joining protein LigD